MSAITGIEWTDATWNPVRGCSRVSEGCRNCYAEKVAARFSEPGLAYHGFAARSPARWTGRVELVEKHLLDPLRWRKPRRIFVNSMSDLFHESLPDEAIDRVFAVMALAPRHTFQILTKRPERMQAWFAGKPRCRVLDAGMRVLRDYNRTGMLDNAAWPLPNVHLGVSTEDQATADERIPLLLQTPAAVRFISAEPLLGAVDLGMDSATCDCCPRHGNRWIQLKCPRGPDLPWLLGGERTNLVADIGVYRAESNSHGALSVKTPGGLLGVKPSEFHVLPRLDWVIVGGESGPRARPCDIKWIRNIVQQTRAAGVPCFVKQLGAKPLGLPFAPAYTTRAYRPEGYSKGWRDHGETEWHGALYDRKGGNPAEWPEDLRVREFPGGAS